MAIGRKSASKKSGSTGQSQKSRAGAGASARSSARSTAGGPAGKDRARDRTDTAAEKQASTETLAAAFPFNAAKPSEFGAAARRPATGQSVEAPDISVTGSTLSEDTASAKVGAGSPEIGENPAAKPLDRVRVDSSGRPLTTNQGVAIGDNQNSLKAGFRGPTLLEDFVLREKITHFDHERIPERIVHARGSGAHGYFECYERWPN